VATSAVNKNVQGVRRRFVTIPIDEFRKSPIHDELGCTLQRVEMEKCPRSPEDIQKYGALTEEQMGRKAKVSGLGASGSTINSKKRMKFVNQDFNAAINVRRCTVIERRPPELTRENFAEEPLKAELYEKKLKPLVGGRSKKTGRRLHISGRSFVLGAFAATTVNRWRLLSTFERRSRVSPEVACTASFSILKCILHLQTRR